MGLWYKDKDVIKLHHPEMFVVCSLALSFLIINVRKELSACNLSNANQVAIAL